MITLTGFNHTYAGEFFGNPSSTSYMAADIANFIDDLIGLSTISETMCGSILLTIKKKPLHLEYIIAAIYGFHHSHRIFMIIQLIVYHK